MNLSWRVGDDPAAVAENLQRFLATSGVRTIRTAKQVHGDCVFHVGAEGVQEDVEADALFVTSDVSVGVYSADCVPVLLGDRRTGAAAAVHAGWRGSLAEIARAALAAFVEAGSDPRDLVAAIGPAIGPCCYEVSPELAVRFRERFGPEVAQGRRLDLSLANRRLLEEGGIPAASIDSVGTCTSCDEARFFSHRRDRGRTGRQLSFITGRFLDSPPAPF